ARYKLPSGLLLAHRDRTLLFGPLEDDAGLWSRTVLLLAGRGGPNLPGVSDFPELGRDISVGFEGLLYLNSPLLCGLVGEPAHGDTLTMLAFMDVANDELSVDVRTRPVTIHTAPPTTQPVARLLPADAIFVWTGALDIAGFLRPSPTSKPAEQSRLP